MKGAHASPAKQHDAKACENGKEKNVPTDKLRRSTTCEKWRKIPHSKIVGEEMDLVSYASPWRDGHPAQDQRGDRGAGRAR